MKLYLVQHGEAKSEHEDPARPLSEKGRKDVEKIAEFLKPLGLRVSKILHSGKLRAMQTAEILSRAISSEQGVQQASGLAPLDDPEEWAQKLQTETSDIVIVGHLPHLAKLAGLLFANDPERAFLKFVQGAIFCLERNPEGKGVLEWGIVPQLIK